MAAQLIVRWIARYLSIEESQVGVVRGENMTIISINGRPLPSVGEQEEMRAGLNKEYGPTYINLGLVRFL